MFALDASAPNIFPSRYRSVALSDAAVDLDEAALTAHFVGRDAYMRTRFIVVRNDDETALIEVVTAPSEALFSPIEHVRLLAGPQNSRYLLEPDVDVGVASQFASAVADNPGVDCLIIEGRYSHVSFLLNPQPLWIEVLDIVPPRPSKLADQAQRILDVAEDLPPVGLLVDERDSIALLPIGREAPDHVLMPCRTSGVELAGAEVSYLDQRPNVQDWTLVGCERSVQIHAEFYGEEPRSVDTCPRRFLERPDGAQPTLTRCCLLQQGMERRDRSLLVPWGASLDEVRVAIDRLIADEGLVWTPT